MSIDIVLGLLKIFVKIILGHLSAIGYVITFVFITDAIKLQLSVIIASKAT